MIIAGIIFGFLLTGCLFSLALARMGDDEDDLEDFNETETDPRKYETWVNGKHFDF